MLIVRYEEKETSNKCRRDNAQKIWQAKLDTEKMDKVRLLVGKNNISFGVDKMTKVQEEILESLKVILSESPELSILELIGNCFAAGDISHIKDEELKDNLDVLLDLDRERAKRVA